MVLARNSIFRENGGERRQLVGINEYIIIFITN